MTENERNKFVTALCGYLPYNPIITNESIDGGYGQRVFPSYGSLYQYIDSSKIDSTRIYLRPMSSMTFDESAEFALLQTDFYSEGWLYPLAAENLLEWLNKRYFDYRNLIGKGLALEAQEGMYN